MANSQSESKIFSVRIVSVDYYMAPPIPNVDICYSSFQGEKINEVPVIRIYGSTPAGQKACVHVHKALPYLYVPCAEIPLQSHREGDAYTHAISLALERALKLKGSAASKRQHVHGCSLVRARKFYGYHAEEELFVKIYFYHPNDVSRAANLLLAGEVMERSLQPYESHIPYILQFFVDYNLHGMGYLHLVKMKFRIPVPDKFCRADACGSSPLGSTVWLSSSIPTDWMWEFPGDYDALLGEDIFCVTRQSVCELEGDAIVEEILNQQFKMYTSLSQTRSDVKMVQSLIPIWEEEYERTGMHMATIPPDPGKPLPEDVLRSLSPSLELVNKFMNLCGGAGNSLNPYDENIDHEHKVASPIDDGNAVQLDSRDSHLVGDSSNLLKDENNIGSRSLDSTQSLPHKEVDAVLTVEGTCPKSVLTNELESTQVIGTANVKSADKEALQLLRWLATSEGAEDINSDDDLAHETILSPLLPAVTIDKVLEKASMDYESESQKDCQDILDSVGASIDLKSLQDRASGSSDHTSIRERALEKNIPQVDGACDDPNSASSDGGDSSELEMKTGWRWESPDEVQQSSSTSSSQRNKIEKPSWGSIPFVVTEKVRNITHNSDSTDQIGSSYSGGKVEKCSDASMNIDRNVKQATGLVGCSVRDLMRKKRCHRVELPDSELSRVKRIHLEEDKKNVDTSYFCDNNGREMTEPAALLIDKKELPQVSEPKGQDHAVALRLSSICQDNVPDGVNSSQTMSHGIHISSSEAGLNVWSTEFGSENKYAADKRLHESSSEHAVRTQVSENMMALDDGNCDDREQCGSVSRAGHLTSVVVNKNLEPLNSIGMTLGKKPPVVDWKVRGCESVLSEYPLTTEDENNEQLSGKRLDDISPFFGGGCQEDEVWNKYYYENDYKVLQESILGIPTHCQNDGACLYLLTPVISPPSVNSVSRWLLQSNTGCKNLVPAGKIDKAIVRSSPEGSESSPIASSSSLPDDCCKELADAGSAPHIRNAVDPAYHETIKNHNSQRKPSSLDESKELQSIIDMTKVNKCSDNSQDASQISGPEGTLRTTPLSQLGFRDPASVGAGQQLTLLSLEVIADSRGDLRPDPRFDAINVISLAIQNDNDSLAELYVLLRSNTESDSGYIDGIPGCKMFVFSEEKQLFNHFVKTIRSSDPDVIMGWDIQGASLGFLAERALHLGVGLLNKISRTPMETKMTAGESWSPENTASDILQQESLVADTGQIQDAIIEDEWGRTHASGVHVGGRIVLNTWRLMRGELKLNMYTVEAVSEAVLRRKVPSIPPKVLTKWYSSGPARARYRCIEYVMDRSKLNLEIMMQLDMINRTSELARVFGIEFFSVLSRGSQYRVESMFLRLAHAQNYLAISPGNQQVASQPAMECIPLVMEPESGFYADPVVVLDFQSLYPSMIIAYNLCFSTCLGKVVPSKPNTLGVCSYSPKPEVLQELKDQILLTPNGVMYAPSKVRKGVLPRLLEEILETRIMVKQAMKKLAPSQKVLQKIFNARQLALKLIANVTYGYTAAGFSGRMPCAELADSIVQSGRSTLEKAISFVNTHDKWKAKVIYGDTDSMFVLLKGRSVAESFQIGNEIASAITAMNPSPVALKMEKVYHPCFLLTKKRYVGYSYESPDQSKPTFDAKGIETVRRDTCGAVSKTMEQCLRLFFEHQHLFEVKSYLQRQWKRILSGRVSLQDFVFAKEVRLGTYSSSLSSSLPPAAIVASKAMRSDPRAEPRYAERVPYVVIHGEPGARLVDMVVDPLDLLAIDSPYRLNDIYYITKQIIPALQRVFGLLGADLTKWFTEMPRPVREAISKRPFGAQNSHRTRIDYYYLSKHCILCGELVQASTHICAKCSTNEIAVATAVVGRTSKLERDMQHLCAICRHCGGGDWLVESGVKCRSLACSVFYERCKVQKELQGLAAVATEKGFYPKCNVEWF